jgi:hypothetical protein
MHPQMDGPNVRIGVYVRTIDIHDMCFHKKVIVEQVDAVLSSSTDYKFAQKDLDPSEPMSVLLAPNSHVPHLSESVVLQANPIPISYIRKSFGVLEPFLTEDVFRCVP